MLLLLLHSSHSAALLTALCLAASRSACVSVRACVYCACSWTHYQIFMLGFSLCGPSPLTLFARVNLQLVTSRRIHKGGEGVERFGGVVE